MAWLQWIRGAFLSLYLLGLSLPTWADQETCHEVISVGDDSSEKSAYAIGILSPNHEKLVLVDDSSAQIIRLEGLERSDGVIREGERIEKPSFGPGGQLPLAWSPDSQKFAWVAQGQQAKSVTLSLFDFSENRRRQLKVPLPSGLVWSPYEFVDSHKGMRTQHVYWSPDSRMVGLQVTLFRKDFRKSSKKKGKKQVLLLFDAQSGHFLAPLGYHLDNDYWLIDVYGDEKRLVGVFEHTSYEVNHRAYEERALPDLQWKNSRTGLDGSYLRAQLRGLQRWELHHTPLNETAPVPEPEKGIIMPSPNRSYELKVIPEALDGNWLNGDWVIDIIQRRPGSGKSFQEILLESLPTSFHLNDLRVTWIDGGMKAVIELKGQQVWVWKREEHQLEVHAFEGAVVSGSLVGMYRRTSDGRYYLRVFELDNMELRFQGLTESLPLAIRENGQVLYSGQNEGIYGHMLDENEQVSVK